MKTMTRIPRVSTRMCGPARALKSYDCAIISRHAAFRIQTDPAPHPSPLGNLFSALLVFVAQTASLLYRRMTSCRTAPWPGRRNTAKTLPICNRRYSRLAICATLNRYPLRGERVPVGRVTGILHVSKFLRGKVVAARILGIALLASLSLGVLPARAQDDDAKEKAREQQEQAKEKEREKRELEKEKREQERESERAYQKARKLVDKGQWEEALGALEETIERGGSRTDGALYWKAYTQNKLNQRAEALATLAELTKRFPESRWLNDARAMEVDIRQASGQAVNPDTQADEELKLIAINSLMHTDSEKALPMLRKLLEGNQPPTIKEKALFVLSQSGSDKAREIVGNFARGKANPDLQLKSLEYLALFGGKESRQVLADVYASTSEKKIKRAILHFFMIGGDRDRLLAAAKGEQDPELRGEAIGQLGVMGSREELYELYRSESEMKVKKRILDAIFVGGAAERMIELAKNEKDADLRRSAIEKLGLMGSAQTAEALVSLYSGETDKALRKKVIEALFLQGNAKAIVEIYRKETDPELKKKAVEQLSIMNSEEGSKLFQEILDK